MKQRMMDHSSAASSHSFLLDDDSTLPFAAAEVLGAMDDKDLYAGIPLPEALKGGAGEHAPGAAPGATTPGGADGAAGGAAAAGGGFAFLEKELRFSQQAGTPGAGPGA